MHIAALNDPDDFRLSALVRIYVKAFPANERKPNSCFAEMIARPDYRVIVAEDGDVIVGFAVLFLPSQSDDAALLEYIGVDPSSGGKGIGTALFQNASALADRRPMLMEVESAEDLSADRRRKLYRRIGCRRITGFQYLLPLPHAPSMELFTSPPCGQLAATQLRRWLITIYRDVYGCPEDDPRLIKMITQLPETILLD